MSAHNSKYYTKSLKTHPVETKNVKTLLCQQSTEQSTWTSSSISIDLSSEKTAEGTVQLTSTSIST